ncbi:hypothetical protein HIM_06934 [Hirsutella minnesotensis 3608]|uniref:Diphthamide biosynthesis protein 4 n=1 Tax=Hirsutella minnesotensis 3608 TaxID=1043627 RepID=A0A0F7ZIC3_9HYPO|nr:hypothetical protein HIM_06934 [Hirsutella minnesotensis 3608]
MTKYSQTRQLTEPRGPTFTHGLYHFTSWTLNFEYLAHHISHHYMAAALASEDRAPQPMTHYQVLALTPAMLDDAATKDPAALVKRAYHRALLRNHPDKVSPGGAPPTGPQHPLSLSFTVDQISSAFAVLSSPSRRAAYDVEIRLSRSARPGPGSLDFQTGVENVDLDDLVFDRDQDRWCRSCRCGNDRGYSFDENDLLDAGEEGLLMVGCQDCSLWLRVHYAVVEDEEEPHTTG